MLAGVLTLLAYAAWLHSSAHALAALLSNGGERLVRRAWPLQSALHMLSAVLLRSVVEASVALAFGSRHRYRAIAAVASLLCITSTVGLFA